MMENQFTLFKGELMEEKLRNYFLNLNYYVVRGIKYSYKDFSITDVDLFLYGRFSSISRQRINVDIKNKKQPQAFERILWANGLKELLDFDKCIVATSDKKESVQNFGQIHNTLVLDGSFLNKLKPIDNRIPEESILKELSKIKSFKTFNNKSWQWIYDSSKSRLLNEVDFSGFNSTLTVLDYFVSKMLTDHQNRNVACRLSYIILSHLMIILDFIYKDIAFLEQNDREKKLLDGFKFGNLGKEGIDKTISMALKISGSKKSLKSYYDMFDSIPVDILKEFFGKNENAKNLFIIAKDFEKAGFTTDLKYPKDLDKSLKSIFAVFLDYFQCDRKKYLENMEEIKE